MAYKSQTGELNDSTWRNQTVKTFGESYLIDGGGVSLGDSTTSIVTQIEASVFRFGNEIVTPGQQTVTHSDGNASDPRVDAIYVTADGSLNVTEGIAQPADPENRIFPNVTQPVPRPLADGTPVGLAFLWVPAGAGSSSELYNDYLIDRRIPGTALNDLELIPGRDLQYQLDQAREGETLRGDRSQPITLAQPLVVNTPDITIRDLNLIYANGAASSSTDDMLTLDADGVTVENLTIGGNKANQTAEPDGVTVTASDCTIRNVRGRNTAGHLVNVNGGSQRVEGTIIESVRGDGCAKDVLIIQGDDAITTKARNIRGTGSDSRGTITVRNGCNEVVLEDPRGENQARVLHFEDFGPDNDASAAVQNVRVEGLKASSCNQAVTHALSTEFNHADFTFRDVSLSGMSPTESSIIGLRGVSGVRVADSALTGSWTGAHALGLALCSRVRVEGNDVTHDATGGNIAGILLSNCARIKAIDNICYEIPLGIRVTSTQGAAQRNIRTNGNTFLNVTGDAIRFDEADADSTLDQVIVRENFTNGAAIDDTAISGQKTVNTNY